MAFHLLILTRILFQHTIVSIDSRLRDEVNHAVVCGGNVLHRLVRTGETTRKCIAIAEHVIAAFGLESKFLLPFLVY